jgi:hypothetical protein
VWILQAQLQPWQGLGSVRARGRRLKLLPITLARTPPRVSRLPAEYTDLSRSAGGHPIIQLLTAIRRNRYGSPLLPRMLKMTSFIQHQIRKLSARTNGGLQDDPGELAAEVKYLECNRFAPLFSAIFTFKFLGLIPSSQFRLQQHNFYSWYSSCIKILATFLQPSRASTPSNLR